MVHVIMFNLSDIWHASTSIVRNISVYVFQEHLPWDILNRHGKTEKRCLDAILFD